MWHFEKLETDGEVPVKRCNMSEYDFTEGESARVERVLVQCPPSSLLSPPHTLCGVLTC